MDPVNVATLADLEPYADRIATFAADGWYLANRSFDPVNPALAAAMAKVPHKCAGHASHNAGLEAHQADFYYRKERA